MGRNTFQVLERRGCDLEVTKELRLRPDAGIPGFPSSKFQSIFDDQACKALKSVAYEVQQNSDIVRESSKAAKATSYLSFEI